MDTFYQSLSKTLPLEFPKVAIHPGTARGDIPRDEPGASRGTERYRRPFGNMRLNSRIGLTLPAGEWHVSWKCALTDFLEARYVLDMEGLAIVQGDAQWQLVSQKEGRTLRLGNNGRSDIAVSPDGASFYYMDANGFVAWHSSDGELEHLCFARLQEQYRRLLIRREAAHYFVVSLSNGRPPWGPGDLWAVEKISIGDSSRVDVGKVLLDSDSAGMLIQKKDKLLIPASAEGTTVLATRERLYLMNDDLRITRALTGKFDPLALSTDPLKRVYVLVRTENVTALWMVTFEGERVFSFAIPAELQVGAFPPIVGYGHQVYLFAGSRVVAIAPSGALLWEHELQGGFGGAVVTAEDQLLVSEGSCVSAFDIKGQRRTLYRLTDESARTPPVLTSTGGLLVATERNLYRLTTAGVRN